jgi:acetyl esterase/lipase
VILVLLAQVVELWPGPVPGDVGIPGEEKVFQLQVKGKPYEVGGRPTSWRTNVSRPTLTVFRPARPNGAAMIVCPGGGYHNLGWDVEGEEVAAWLNSIGITALLLKYRCPRRPGDEKGVPPKGPLIDAQRAIRLARSRAGEWGIDPARIGMVGFSAGGHLVGSAATNAATPAYEPLDAADAASCRPDFAVMLYSGYFKAKDGGLSPTIGPGAGAPPMLLVHASDDAVSDAEHSVTMYLAMKRAGANVAIHVYASGGHGFAVRKVGHPSDGWTSLCVDWLKKLEVLR